MKNRNSNTDRTASFTSLASAGDSCRQTDPALRTAEPFNVEPRSPVTAPQLELGFSGATRRAASPRQRRLSRANWWFRQMRQIVDGACDWQPATPPRPEQMWFSNTDRQPLADDKHALAE